MIDTDKRIFHYSWWINGGWLDKVSWMSLLIQPKSMCKEKSSLYIVRISIGVGPLVMRHVLEIPCTNGELGARKCKNKKDGFIENQSIDWFHMFFPSPFIEWRDKKGVGEYLQLLHLLEPTWETVWEETWHQMRDVTITYDFPLWFQWQQCENTPYLTEIGNHFEHTGTGK